MKTFTFKILILLLITSTTILLFNSCQEETEEDYHEMDNYNQTIYKKSEIDYSITFKEEFEKFEIYFENDLEERRLLKDHALILKNSQTGEYKYTFSISKDRNSNDNALENYIIYVNNEGKKESFLVEFEPKNNYEIDILLLGKYRIWNIEGTTNLEFEIDENGIKWGTNIQTIGFTIITNPGGGWWFNPFPNPIPTPTPWPTPNPGGGAIFVIPTPIPDEPTPNELWWDFVNFDLSFEEQMFLDGFWPFESPHPEPDEEFEPNYRNIEIGNKLREYFIAQNCSEIAKENLKILIPYLMDNPWQGPISNDFIDKLFEHYFYDKIDLTDIEGTRIKCVYDKLNTIGGTLYSYLKDFRGKNALLDLDLQKDDEFGSHCIGDNCERTIAHTVDATAVGRVQIIFNTDSSTNGYIYNLSDIQIAKTIIHEVIHAHIIKTLLILKDETDMLNQSGFTPEEWENYINSIKNDYKLLKERYDAYMQNNTVNLEGVSDFDHEEIAFHYIDVIITALKEFDPNLTQAQYSALAWSGLKNSIAWQNFLQQNGGFPIYDEVNDVAIGTISEQIYNDILLSLQNTYENECPD